MPIANYQHLSVDLLDAHKTADVLGGATDEISHVVFGAYLEGTSLADQLQLNVSLLQNTLNALDSPTSALRHVTVYQGSKAYGDHLGPIKTPTKERDPPLLGPHFYAAQETILRRVSGKRGFRFTVLRPDLVIGYAYGTPMNLLMTIAVYATVCKHLGLPLRFPGTRAAYEALIHCTDAELLARATVWAGQTEEAADQVFNVANGDQFRFVDIWGSIARYFDMEVAPPIPLGLAEHMADKGPVWDEITKQHNLRQAAWYRLVNWNFFDGYALNANATDVFGSTIKIRQAGFADCYDTEDRFLVWLDRLKTARIIP